ncbi:hypothetical protein FAM18108_03070 [Lacticaseibacillus paracasei]|uniref:hypothetical protein n=1 Tax=Lacticaseibacillus paracasei TaxID=1597 RepID=UPI000F0B8B0D|nr:hypothetical protein [Lacticaseibacillus paracasei]RND42949.1 hypothetical protein FAM18108_03070 [Lacticaseibacillus paracasei]
MKKIVEANAVVVELDPQNSTAELSEVDQPCTHTVTLTNVQRSYLEQGDYVYYNGRTNKIEDLDDSNSNVVNENDL